MLATPSFASQAFYHVVYCSGSPPSTKAAGLKGIDPSSFNPNLSLIAGLDEANTFKELGYTSNTYDIASSSPAGLLTRRPKVLPV
jgi:hypothetical protein